MPAIGVPARRLLARASLLAVVLAATLLILEGLVRLFAPRALMVPWQDDIHGVTAPKLEVSGRFAIRGRFDTTVTIHDRFRSRRPISRQPAPDTTRIAVLGDSATFGWGVEDDETYPAILGQVLNAQGSRPGARAVEVLNAGVIGTGTGEQALWYDLWVKQYSPAIVVLSVFPNDVDDDTRGGFFDVDVRSGAAWPRPFDVLERGLDTVRRTRAMANRVPGFNWLSQHSELFTWVRQGPTEFLTARRAKAIGASAGAMDHAASLSLPELMRLRGEIRWLRDAIQSRLVVVFLPSAEAFDRTRPAASDVVGRSTQIVAALHAMASEDGIPFLDVQQVVGERPDAQRLFFKDDPHANAAGTRAFAEAVAPFLRRELR